MTKASLFLLSLVFAFAVISCGDDGDDSTSSSWTPPSNYTTLSNGEWTTGSITSSVRESWYGISVTSGTLYYVWLNDYDGDGTYSMDVVATAYDSNGITIFSADDAWYIALSFIADFSGTVYIKVVPCSSSSTGDFAIAYSTSSARPGSVDYPGWTPPTTYTTLNDGEWETGSITSSDLESWYGFSVTSGTRYYVWWNDWNGNGAYSLDVTATAYYSNGIIIFSDDDAWYGARLFTANSGGTVYIKVVPRSSTSTGDFAIMYSTTNTKPNDEITLPADCTTLTEGKWTSGNIPSSGIREEWFKFTATTFEPYMQFIHVSFGTLTGLSVQVYDSSGDTVGTATSLNRTTRHAAREVTLGQIYYIRVTTSSPTSHGTYDIAFNKSSTDPVTSWPPSSYTNISRANLWVDGNIEMLGEQWFRFTATTSATNGQYIHVSFGLLNNVYVQLYDSSGDTVGTTSYLHDNTRYFSQSLTLGLTYYIRVWPGYYYYHGDFRIAFNTSDSRPAN
jgi:hypothetical protein